MPKDLKDHLREQQRQRQRINAKSAKYSPTYAHLQVIGHGTRAESRCLVLCTDHRNYLFNCGEGTQRLASEHHVKLAKVEHVFVTRPSWSNLGGLPGYALTMQETGVKTVCLHGPPAAFGIMQAMHNFVVLNELTIVPADLTGPFSDQTMTVDYVLVRGPGGSDDNDTDAAGSGQTTSKPVPGTQKQKSLMNDLIIYICKLHKRAGTLNLEKCLELGIPNGPLLGKLKSGADVTLPNGTVVKSQDVISESDPGPVFIVLECPDEEWMELIIENPAFVKYHQDTDKENMVHTLVHFTPENILSNSKYKKWMQKFGPNTLHLILNENNTGYSSEAVHKMQHQLHLIHPTIFPLLQDQENFSNLKNSLNVGEETLEQSAYNSKSESEKDTNKDLDPNFIEDGLQVRRCKTMDIVHLQPNKGLKTDSNVKICPNHYIQEVMDTNGFSDTLKNLQAEINVTSKTLGDNTEEYPRILMLGTGSCIPNKVRNTSGILLQLSEKCSILLDCGEATINQIRRFFGEIEADRVLKSIKAVYVSHMHADHHLGFIGILEQRKRVTDEPIFLLAPQLIIPYIYYYHENINRILDDFTLICNEDMLLDEGILLPDVAKDLYESLNVASINTTFVVHCAHAYAIAITLMDGRNICYSGDTMPCETVMELASNGFLLIHEATMEDELADEAIIKRHSTFSQAVNMGVVSNVNFTLLTHFSQRYSKLPMLPDSEASGIDYSRLGIAYDFMLISLSRLALLPLFFKPLTIMFSEFQEELNQRAMKRSCPKERCVEAAEV